MPKLILRCNYLKDAPPSHLANYMNYISTREGVEKIDNTCGLLPATVKQKELIEDILSKIEDADRMHEYYDYLQKPNRENATEFITQALENNLDIIAKKKNYIDYLANRPRVEKIGTHGLFSNEGESIVLSRVAEEVANHPGVVWTNVISLRREDAEKLGYDCVAQWQALLRSRVELLCENYKIDSRNLKWYAAFHNESHHPHVHLVVYSNNPSEGYLTKKGIDTMRSTYAHDIFRQEFMSIYEKKTQRREQLKEQANKSLLILLQEMKCGVCHNEKIAEDMQLLSKRLMNTGGKKVYGYLKADVKAIINRIVNELAKEEMVAECYRKWLESKNEIMHYYKDADEEQIPLSEQKEFKSLKNMVIREALRYGEGYFYTEDEDVMEAEGEDGTESHEGPEDMAEIIPEDWDGVQEAAERTGSFFYAEWTDVYKEARGYLYGTDEMMADEEAAYEIMKEEAKRGNVYAMHDMGKIYAQGIFVDADPIQAQEWYEKALTGMLAVERGEENAYLEYRIGKMYQYGLGTEENLQESARWFGMASDKNHKYALYSLGMLYLHGKGMEPDDTQAFALFLRSHKKGNPYASYELGKLYEAGRGTEKSMKLAEECYRAAFLGFLKMEKKSKNDTLWYRIGVMYLKGIGTEPDARKAEKYLLKAADYGNANAQYVLGKVYLMGKDVPQDREKAYAYFTLAAEQGNAYAAFFLEHWNEIGHPDLFLMATRLLHHLEQIIEEDVFGRKGTGGIRVDRKLARKMKQKKMAQGHAADDREVMVQTQ